MNKIAILFPLALLLSCSNSGEEDDIVNATPLPVQERAVLAGESPAALPGAAEGSSGGQESPYDNNFGSNQSLSGGKHCLGEMSRYYNSWYSLAAPFSFREYAACDTLRLWDENGKKILDILLFGRCRLSVQVSLEYTSIKKQINICAD